MVGTSTNTMNLNLPLVAILSPHKLRLDLLLLDPVVINFQITT